MQAVASAAGCDDLKLIVISDHEGSRVFIESVRPGEGDFEPGQLIDFCRVNRLSVTVQSIQTSETSFQ